MIDDEIDLFECALIVIRKWKYVAAITGSIAILAVVYALIQPNIYQSTAIISPAKIQKSSIESASFTEVLLKNPRNIYLLRIADELGLAHTKIDDLKDRFDVSETADCFLISGRGDTPEDAQTLALGISSIIQERQNNLIKDALSITENEIDSLKVQLKRIYEEIANLDKKISLKEKTDNVAQSYVFQALIESKESALKRETALSEKLRQKEMEIKYFTKSASVIAPASLPEKKIAPYRAKIVIIATVVGFLVALFIAFIIEYCEKRTCGEGMKKI